MQFAQKKKQTLIFAATISESSQMDSMKKTSKINKNIIQLMKLTYNSTIIKYCGEPKYRV